MTDQPEGLRMGNVIHVEQFGTQETLSIKVVSGVVASGGQAQILKGQMQSPGQLAEPPIFVAIKIIAVKNVDVDQVRIERELTAVKLARHRHILPFIATLRAEKHTILVSKFMVNGSMLEYLKAKPAAKKEPLILEVSEAVDHLHSSLGLVHGDLKCQNVLISDYGHALLADFGLSTTAGEAVGEDPTVTTIRTSMTLRFAAPEILLDTAISPLGKLRSKTTQTDVYAFGMLIVQAFTGTHPWPGLKDACIYLNVCQKAPYPRPGNSLEIGLTEPWWQLCEQCLQYDPNARPSIVDIYSSIRMILRVGQEGSNADETYSGTVSDAGGYASSTDSLRVVGIFHPQSLRTMPARPVDFGMKVSPLHAILYFCGDHKAFNLPKEDEASFLKFDQITPTYGHIGEGNSGYREANAWLLEAVRGPQKALEQLPPTKRDWIAVVNAFQLCPLLIPSPAAAIDRTDEYTMERRNLFKRDAVYKSVGEKLAEWFSTFWDDRDVEQGPGAEDMRAVHDIVTHAGRILDGDPVYRKERQTKTVLDIGVLRYPDISCPYVKVYRIELVAWYESTTVGAYTRDRNGLMAKFNLRQYEPDAKAIEELREKWRRDALNDFMRQHAEAARQAAQTRMSD